MIMQAYFLIILQLEKQSVPYRLADIKVSFCYESSSDLTLAAAMRKGSLSYHGSHKLALDSPVVKYGAVFTVANMLANNGDFIQVKHQQVTGIWF